MWVRVLGKLRFPEGLGAKDYLVNSQLSPCLLHLDLLVELISPKDHLLMFGHFESLIFVFLYEPLNFITGKANCQTPKHEITELTGYGCSSPAYKP